MLRLLLFNLYMLPLGDVMAMRHGVNVHSYTDDLKLYFAN